MIPLETGDSSSVAHVRAFALCVLELSAEASRAPR